MLRGIMTFIYLHPALIAIRASHCYIHNSWLRLVCPLVEGSGSRQLSNTIQSGSSFVLLPVGPVPSGLSCVVGGLGLARWSKLGPVRIPERNRRTHKP